MATRTARVLNTYPALIDLMTAAASHDRTAAHRHIAQVRDRLQIGIGAPARGTSLEVTVADLTDAVTEQDWPAVYRLSYQTMALLPFGYPPPPDSLTFPPVPGATPLTRATHDHNAPHGARYCPTCGTALWTPA